MGLLGDATTPAEPPPRILLQDDQGRTVRSAQSLEDVHIANLRLSVFADVVCAAATTTTTTTDRRSQFCAYVSFIVVVVACLSLSHTHT